MRIQVAGRNGHRQSAFTLVELLVVIGIIAVLIGVLLPALTNARNSAKTVVCLSNMRQLSLACAMYASQTGYTVPAWVLGAGAPTSGSTNPLVNQTVNGTVFHIPGAFQFQTWPTILYTNKLITPNLVGSIGDGPMTSGVFYCPSALPDFLADGVLSQPVGSGWSQDQWYQHDTNAGLAAGYRFFGKDAPNGNTVMIDSWYGINASDVPGSGASETPNWGNTPSATTPFVQVGSAAYLHRITKIRDNARVAFLYDGVYVTPSRDAGRINGRHGKDRKYTNIAFVDGHAETVPRFDLPWLATTPYGPSNQFSFTKLAQFPNVHWRTDGR